MWFLKCLAQIVETFNKEKQQGLSFNSYYPSLPAILLLWLIDQLDSNPSNEMLRVADVLLNKDAQDETQIYLVYSVLFLINITLLFQSISQSTIL